MTSFGRRLEAVNPAPENRRWLFVPYDQLSDQIGPLASEPAESLGIVLVESRAKAARRPYHRQKLALVLANLRHFGIEQAERGVAVRYLTTSSGYGAALAPLVDELGALRVMEPAESELRQELQPLVDGGGVEVIAHAGWLTTPEQFGRAFPQGPPWKMDTFYRRVRRQSGLLMDGDEPIGGKFSFDAENRRAWPGEPAAPDPPGFVPDDITREVGELVAERFARHPGRVDLAALPATRDDAERLWRWALEHCMEHFGPYEDAMSARSRGLFHTRISALLNLHRLLPRRVVEEAAASAAPLQSREGFVRQVLGWREFMRHVHRETDGFRRLPDADVRVEEQPGDGGWSRWTGQAWQSGDAPRSVAGGAAPRTLDADWPLPPAFWGERSGLACLDAVVRDVWDEAYTHHIPRLMVLANLGTLLGVRPRELTDWFWAAFGDAYDWVVEPNVLGMGTYAVGGLFTTKPYVAGANYIHRMSDYCQACRFDPKRTCPITRLYWAFLDRNRERLQGNPRMGLVLGSLRRRSKEQRREDRRTFDGVRRRLERGLELKAGTRPRRSTG